MFKRLGGAATIRVSSPAASDAFDMSFSVATATFIAAPFGCYWCLDLAVLALFSDGGHLAEEVQGQA